MQRHRRHSDLLGQRTVATGADADLLPVLADVRVAAATTPAHAVAQHGVASDPHADPGPVDAIPDAGDPAGPLVSDSHRVPREALFEIGHLARVELHVRAAQPDALDVDDDFAGGRGRRRYVVHSALPGAGQYVRTHQERLSVRHCVNGGDVCTGHGRRDRGSSRRPVPLGCARRCGSRPLRHRARS